MIYIHHLIPSNETHASDCQLGTRNRSRRRRRTSHSPASITSHLANISIDQSACQKYTKPLHVKPIRHTVHQSPTTGNHVKEEERACFPSVHHHLTEFACVPLAPSSVQCLHFSCMPIISRPCPSSTTGIDIYCTLLLSSGSSEWLSVCLSVCAEEPLTTLFYKYKSFTGCSCTTYCSAKYGFRFSATLCSR